MLSRLEQPWVQLIDVRTPEEYAGRDIRTLRGGHIPGAINIPFAAFPAFDAGAEADAGAGAGAGAGARATPLATLDRRKETIVYGRDAEQSRWAAERLRNDGFRDVRVYADGWQVWGNMLELPVAAERFADVASLRAQLEELQRKLDQLSGQPAASLSSSAARQLAANR